LNDRNIAGGLVSLLDALHEQLPGTEGAILLSADGLELALSTGTSPQRADQLAAVSAALHALADATNRNNGGRRVDQTVVEMDYRMLVIVPVTGETLLAVVFDAVNDLSGIRERIAAFADRIGLRLAEVDLSRHTPDLVPLP